MTKTKSKDLMDGELHVVTEDDCHRPWAGQRDGYRFRCYMCGHKFVAGDSVRFLILSGAPNLMVGGCCNSDDVVDRWRARCAEIKRLAEGEWWWHLDEIIHPSRYQQ